jgi:hypothetical protein
MADERCAECRRRVTEEEENTQRGGWFARAAPTGSGVRVVYVCEGCLTDEVRAYYVRLTAEAPDHPAERGGA